ncbi:MAG: hypothetical protein EXQ70_10370 [Solirubrobacterales bacterium]|nr:hypothetical protein [Solirubrobacterales bacterium]
MILKRGAKASPRPRILVVDAEGGRESDQAGLAELIQGLGSRFQVVVLSLADGEATRISQRLGVPHHDAGLQGRRSAIRFPFAARRIADEIRGEGVALVHARGTRAALLGTFLSRHLDAPLVWELGDAAPGRLGSRLIGHSCSSILAGSADAAARFPRRIRDRVVELPGESSETDAIRSLRSEHAAMVAAEGSAPPPPDVALEVAALDATEGFGSSRLIARNTIARSGGEIIAKLASVAFYAVMARELGTGGFGSFIFALSLSSVILVLAGFGMDLYLAREIARDRKLVDVLFTNVMILKGVMLVALLGVLAGIVLVGPYSAETRIAAVLIGTGVAVEMLSGTLYSVVQGFERMEVGAVGLVVQRGVTAVVGIVVLLAGGGLIAASLVFLVGSIVGYVVTHSMMHRVVRPRFRPDRSNWKSVLKAGTPIGLASLMFTLLLRLDASLISFLTGGDQSQVGNYGAAWRLVDATMFIPWSFGAAILPWLSRQGEKSEALLTRGSLIGLKILAAVLVPIGVGYAVFAPSLIEIIYGPGFGDAVQPLRFLGLMTVLYGINAYASELLVARHRPGAFARGIAFVLVFNIAINLFLIPAHGASGAAFSAVVCGVILAVISVRLIWDTVGHFSLTRALGGPTLGGLVMAAIGLLAGLPFVAAAVVSTLAYLLTLLAFERTVFANDFGLVSGVIGAARRPKAAE